LRVQVLVADLSVFLVSFVSEEEEEEEELWEDL
jgi:hypothetical protein